MNSHAVLNITTTIRNLVFFQILHTLPHRKYSEFNMFWCIFTFSMSLCYLNICLWLHLVKINSNSRNRITLAIYLNYFRNILLCLRIFLTKLFSHLSRLYQFLCNLKQTRNKEAGCKQQESTLFDSLCWLDSNSNITIKHAIHCIES